MQPPDGKPGLTATVYHSGFQKAIFFYEKFLNFYKLCYKFVKLLFFVENLPVHHGFQQLLQRVSEGRSLQAEGLQIVPVHSEILQGETGMLRKQRVQRSHAFRHPRIFPLARGMAGGDPVRPVYPEQVAEILFPETVEPAQQKGTIQIYGAGICPEVNIVVAYKTDDPFMGFPVTAQVAGDALRNDSGRCLVSPVMRFAALVHGADGRLAGVVKEHGQAKIRFRRDIFHALDRMLPEIKMMMVIPLVIADHDADFRDNDRENIREGAKDSPGSGAAQQLQKFFADPFCRHVFQGRREMAQCLFCFGINGRRL